MTGVRTILLVDDCQNDLMLLEIALERAGLKTPPQTTRNGDEAIAYLKGEDPYCDRSKHPMPDVTLLDLNMPKKNGFEVLEWVRAQPRLKHIPIVILTASPRVEDVKRAYEAGATAFLVKPAKIQDLCTMMCCLLEWFRYNLSPPLIESSSDA